MKFTYRWQREGEESGFTFSYHDSVAQAVDKMKAWADDAQRHRGIIGNIPILWCSCHDIDGTMLWRREYHPLTSEVTNGPQAPTET